MDQRAGDERAQSPDLCVAVCALTLNRPEGLASLLEGLACLELPAGANTFAVIVDNDPAASARPLVEEWRPRLGMELRYAVEPRRGIPFGRNTAVAVAGEADLIAFIDDDEVPGRSWLAELVRVHRETGAAVVAGPVLPEFTEPPPSWIAQGGFFERKRFADGAPAPWASTGNVLIARRVFPTDAPPFREAMALTGGTDTHLFLRAQMAGHAIVWADRAVVTERIPPTRTNLGWLLRRQYRRGLVLTMSMIDLRDSPVRRVRRAANGVFRMVSGVALLLTGLVRGRVAMVRGLKRLCFGAGLLAGLAGARYEEYRTIHGR